MKTQDIYNNLIQSLRLVASSSDIQISSLPDFVNIADEIALIYNESYMMVSQIDNIITPYVMKMLDDLDKLFNRMSEDESLWNIKSLNDNDLWLKSRELGRLILNELKEECINPNLDFISWVK